MTKCKGDLVYKVEEVCVVCIHSPQRPLRPLWENTFIECPHPLIAKKENNKTLKNRNVVLSFE